MRKLVPFACLGCVVLGAVLLSTAALAARGGRGATVKDGGVLRLNISSSDIQSIDPAIDYEFLGGALEVATCLKLVNYPDKPAPAGAVLTFPRLPPRCHGCRPTDGRTRSRSGPGSISTPASGSRPRRSRT